jgi:RNA polymerase sigma factor (sigma-70 family)
VLARAQQGDGRALNALFHRELPALRSWARSHVPRRLWPRADPDDFVQRTFIRALRRYHAFDVRESATFQHYLRRILINLIRDELRAVARQPERTDLVDFAATTLPDPLDLLLGREAHRRYREAMCALPVRTRAAVAARLERGASYQSIATLTAAPNAGAARALVARGVTRLTAEMRRLRDRSRLSRRAQCRTRARR